MGRTNIRRLSRRASSDKVSARRRQTQNRLLKAGSKLIAKHGFGGTSIGDICDLAGYSRGAFYSNFDDQAHFMQALAEKHWDDSLIRLSNYLIDDFGLPVPKVRALPGDPKERLEYFQKLTALVSQDVTTQAPDAAITLGQALLQMVSGNEEFYLLWQELRNYAIRYPGRAEPILQTVAMIRESAITFTDTLLSSYGARASVDTGVFVDCLIGVRERELWQELLGVSQSEILSKTAIEAMVRSYVIFSH